jgi:hypothetical protein
MQEPAEKVGLRKGKMKKEGKVEYKSLSERRRGERVKKMAEGKEKERIYVKERK